MTDYVQQLADRAKKSVPHGLAPDKWIEVYNQKFAELIVVKCANIVWDEAEKTMNKQVNEVGYTILKQFGIKS